MTNYDAYTKDATCPAGWKDLTQTLTSGVFEDKDMLPSPGSEIEVRWAPAWKSDLYSIERLRVTGKRRKLKAGWTVVLEQTFGSFDWDIGTETRLDQLAQRRHEKPGTKVFGRKGQ